MPPLPDDPTRHAVPEDASHPVHARLKWRPILIFLLCVLAAVLLSIDSMNAGLHRLLSAAEPAIAAHPVSGALLFIVLSAFSALVAGSFSLGVLAAPLIDPGALAVVRFILAGVLVGAALTR